ncbi:hypothetical protein C7S20_16870 [Christiangramia fulva]|uniref:Uncharacterized protein n=1 Tax=Christiangramia fulva TaxID=2126553 RepID=A0A2R3Z946_9FLAO|nr:hypothetical protein C7S20_16870 [Christiangramia fulva]
MEIGELEIWDLEKWGLGNVGIGKRGDWETRGLGDLGTASQHHSITTSQLHFFIINYHVILNLFQDLLV